MTAADVVAELSSMGVAVVCTGTNKLRLTVDVGEVPTEAVVIARSHKLELVEYLQAKCIPHNNPGNYIEEPAASRPGWVRVTCRRCGRFLGYRLR
jgi:hypothetical protein